MTDRWPEEDSSRTPQPHALGPYSPVVRAGNMIFVSAQTGVDPYTKKIQNSTFEAECRQAFANLRSATEAGGGRLSDVVKAMILYVDLDDLPVINTVFAEFFPDRPPARTSAMVRLPDGRRIAIDAIAIMSDMR